MTRDELIKTVAKAINNVEAKHMAPTTQHFKYAETAINTIFDALKEPAVEMNDKARYLMSWMDGYDRPTYKNLKTYCSLTGENPPVGCLDVDHVPPKAQRTSWIFKAMLAASPLAPENKQ